MDDGRLPRVAILGRPNVGKSTLFNRIVGRRQAIVGSESGMTRDRQQGEADWTGRAFVLFDTGGVEWGSEDRILAAIQEQALRAVEEADVVLLVVDGREGLVSIEAQLAAEIRRRGVPTFVVVNKCDDPESGPAMAAEFHLLGVEYLFPVSAEHGTGVGDLLDAVVAALPDEGQRAPGPGGATRVAVVGRPNVGKSSLVNALLGAPRVIVSERGGTTRDAIDTVLERDDNSYVIVDTAGIRRAAKQEGFAEWMSVNMARRRMEGADVALLVIDAAVGLSRQDVAIAAAAGRAGCGLIVVVNKWDLIDHEGAPTLAWLQDLRARMGRIRFATFAFVSARSGEGVEELLPLVDRVQANRTRRVPTGELNAMFARLQRTRTQLPPGSPSPKYMTQVGVAPPTFVVFVGGKGKLPDDYRRYLENRLRETFDFTGCPVVVLVRRGRRRR